MSKVIKQMAVYFCVAALMMTGCSNVQNSGQETSAVQHVAAYSNKLFDNSYVHTINIEIAEDNWQAILDDPTAEEYYSCNITIDGETINNAAIRTKGNSSLTQVADSDSDRYSFKINFDKYDKTNSYYGLDKLSLNNIIQDATFMKDYISYTLMGGFGVAAPEVSYSYITINGKEWGLYLNVEDIDEAFLERNYGSDYGNLYKPSTDNVEVGNMGGKDGNRPQMPQMPQAAGDNGEAGSNADEQGQAVPQAQIKDEGADKQKDQAVPQQQNNNENADQGSQPASQGQAKNEEAGQNDQAAPQPPEDMQIPQGGMGDPFGSQNALGADLVYTDDEASSYADIFDNAKTDIDDQDKASLIAALKTISEGENLEEAIDVEATLRYFVVHNFVDNYDSYTGNMLHNYYLYQAKDGKLSMLPWDYNLAFGAFGGMGGKGNKPDHMNFGQPAEGQNTQQAAEGTAGQGAQAADDNTGAADNKQPDAAMQQPKDNAQQPQMGEGQMPAMEEDNTSGATSMINMAIDTPLSGAEEADRPMWTQLISNDTYKEQYHKLFDDFISNFIENGKINEEIDRVAEMITPYIQKDPTAFYTYDEFEKGVAALKSFITLRGQSIRGQLDGTIPSTTEEQNSNPDTLIDGSSIKLSDMGSNGGGKGEKKDFPHAMKSADQNKQH